MAPKMQVRVWQQNVLLNVMCPCGMNWSPEAPKNAPVAVRCPQCGKMGKFIIRQHETVEALE